MPLKVQIMDGSGGTRRSTEVDTSNFLQVAIREGDPPPIGEVNRYRFFSQLVSSAGDGTGTTNMNVNGLSTSQTFSVNSHKDYDIRVMRTMIYIVDTAVTHAKFGSISSLSNGVDISVFEDNTETFLVQAAKDFTDMIQQTFAERPFGATATSFELTDVNTSNNDGWILPMDIGALVPGGLRIGRGTKDRFQVEVNDDLTGLVTFTVRVAGYRHYP